MQYRGHTDLFQFLDDVSTLIQEVSSVLTNWRGVGWLLNLVWECPYRVTRATCGFTDLAGLHVARDR